MKKLYDDNAPISTHTLPLGWFFAAVLVHVEDDMKCMSSVQGARQGEGMTSFVDGKN